MNKIKIYRFCKKLPYYSTLVFLIITLIPLGFSIFSREKNTLMQVISIICVIMQSISLLSIWIIQFLDRIKERQINNKFDEYAINIRKELNEEKAKNLIVYKYGHISAVCSAKQFGKDGLIMLLIDDIHFKHKEIHITGSLAEKCQPYLETNNDFSNYSLNPVSEDIRLSLVQYNDEIKAICITYGLMSKLLINEN